ncbi:efflux RND transporter periplasmic adaptor subunit [Pedobacter sp. BS3]|uniref:efflux RND transporter periplasmic adaptor subunit n=1 Tax=Pedobacter sp. BS3 TaxID=2567937 RepID=UPI0011EF8EA2|nr:efflux RND transporter periplasmic adaptor subunit [Pedobacter sp. BS3]TZF81160.1 efflux RND transporter periplasmic adaptor subunit [Pedobacter sp. BS3]
MAKKNNTLKYVLITAVVLLIIAVVGNKLGWFGNGKKVQVATEKAETRTIIETVSASGKIEPEVEVKLSSEVSGEIVELLVKEGDVVKKGQLLCKIRPDVLQSGYNRAEASLNSQKAALANSEQLLKQAEANYKNTEAHYKRSTELYKQKVLSASEFDAAQAEYQAAKANIEALRQNVIGSRYGVEQSAAAVKEAGDNLAKTTIFAPVDGVISALEVELGERVVGTAQMAGTEIMRIANMNTMQASVDVNESDINRVSINDSAEIEIDAFRNKKFKGIVTEIASSASVTGTSADQVTNFTVKVRILPESYQALVKKDATNPSPFRPGLSATVDIQTNKVTALSVPIQAVTTRDEQKKTDKPDTGQKEEAKKEHTATRFVVFAYQKDGKVKQIPVTTGIQDDTYIQVLSGLNAGDEVVAHPFTAITTTLKDGMAVEKVSKDKLFAADKK